MQAMTKNAERGRDSFRLPPGAFALALVLKYIGLVAYGTHASIVELPSFTEVGGSGFAVAWAIMVTACALAALAGVSHSWHTGKTNLEKWTTAVLVLTFMLYSVVLIVRAIVLGEGDGAPLAWLPAVLSVLSTVRYYFLVWR